MNETNSAGSSGYHERAAAVTLLAVILTNFTGTLAASAINLAVPAVSKEFAGGAETTGWIITGYMLGSVAFLVPFGRIADRTGRKRVFASGVAVFTLMSLVSAFSVSTEMLIVLRFLQGLGAAMLFSTNLAILISAYPPQKRGRVLGIAVAVTYIGLSAGPPIGGALNNFLGWRSIFLVTAFLGSIPLFLILFKLPDDSRAAETGAFDMPGSLLYIAAVTLVMSGVSLWAGRYWALALIPAGLLTGLLFVRHELRQDDPVLDIKLLTRNKNYAFSNLAALLNYSFTAGVGLYLSIYFQMVKGYNSMIAGIIMMGQPALQAIISPYMGKLSDKVSPFRLATFGMTLCAAGLAALCFVRADSHVAYIIAAMAVIGAGFGVFSSPNTNAIMSCVEPRSYAAATSFLATMRNMGQTASLAIVTSIMAVYTGHTVLADAPVSALLSSMRTGFIIFTVLCVIGIFFSMQRRTG
ncbi:MAG: MFS transporter [Treponema sp.]|jgi:EmrB/QacA subfamily drug resistance transporter|nr:MFS transporter [Treponema sp.]